MDFLTYFLASIVSFSGVHIGYLLLFLAPEEKKPGMVYFTYINYGLFTCIALTSVTLIILEQYSLSLLFLPILALILFYSLKKYFIYSAYLFYAVAFWIFSKDPEIFLIFSSAVFLYGLTAGAIMFNEKEKKDSLLKAVQLSYFLLVSVVLKLFL